MRKVGSGPEPFGKDIEHFRSYQYSGDCAPFSALVAQELGDDMIFEGIAKLPFTASKILDHGCGDGFNTMKLAKRFQVPVIGFDPQSKAIAVAQRRYRRPNLSFSTGGLDSGKVERHTVTILRGVIHHLESPQSEIMKILGSTVIVLEPNGLNPILKLIEVLSPYHRAHKERSYTPNRLRSYFESAGFEVSKPKFGVLVPFFAPKALARLLNRLDPLVRRMPLLCRFLCGSTLLVARRSNPPGH